MYIKQTNAWKCPVVYYFNVGRYFSLHTPPGQSRFGFSGFTAEREKGNGKEYFISTADLLEQLARGKRKPTRYLTPQKCLHIQNGEYIYTQASKYTWVL